MQYKFPPALTLKMSLSICKSHEIFLENDALDSIIQHPAAEIAAEILGNIRMWIPLQCFAYLNFSQKSVRRATGAGVRRRKSGPLTYQPGFIGSRARVTAEGKCRYRSSSGIG